MNNQYRFSGLGSSSGGEEIVATSEKEARHLSMSERWGECPPEWRKDRMWKGLGLSLISVKPVNGGVQGDE
jgi:hypothetical protein